MYRILILALAITLVGCAKTEQNLIRGKWEAVSITRDGKDYPLTLANQGVGAWVLDDNGDTIASEGDKIFSVLDFRKNGIWTEATYSPLSYKLGIEIYLNSGLYEKKGRNIEIDRAWDTWANGTWKILPFKGIGTLKIKRDIKILGKTVVEKIKYKRM